MIGTSNSRARIFRPRLISLTSSWRFSENGAAAHQLEVVDHDECQTGPRLHAPRLRADLHHRDTWVVVEEQRHVETVDRPADLRPVGFDKAAGAQLLRIDLGLAGKDALGQLGMTHLQREDQHWSPRGLGDIGGDPQSEAGLAHRRAGTDDVQRRWLQAGEDLVEIMEASGCAGDDVAALERLLQLVHRQRKQIAERSDRGEVDALLGDLEDLRLCFVERLGDVVGLEVGDLGDVAGDTDQLAQHGRVLHDLGVTRRVGDGRRRVLQFEQRLRTADLVEQAIAAKLVGNRHDVDRLTGGGQPSNRR